MYKIGIRAKGFSIGYFEKLVDGHTLYFPMIEFNANNQTYQTSNSSRGFFSKAKRSFTIVYNPQNPNENIILNYIHSILIIISLILFVVVTLFITYKFICLIIHQPTGSGLIH